MRRSVLLTLLLLPVLLSAGTGNHDVNRDGRVDEADVTALARMVAGLDPVDLSFDLNGDSLLTLDDVNLLLDATPVETTQGVGPGPALGFTNTGQPAPTAGVQTPATTSTQSAHANTGMTFFAIRQKTTGQCVVVAGDEGLSPGDTIFGVFGAFQPAQDVIMSQCVGGQAPNRPIPNTQPPVEKVNSLFASPILAVPKYDNDESTEGIFFISLETGNAFFIDKVKGSPLSVRTRTLNQNVFNALDRAPGESARHGDILVGPIRKKSGQMHALLLVDTTTGAMAYISELDSRSYDGRMNPIRGKPALDIIGGGNRFALAMWEAPSGKTEGAFLFNGTTGQGLFLEGVGDLEPYLEIKRTPALPPMPNGVSAVAIHAKDESTSHLLLLDHDAGTLYHLNLPNKRPWEFEVTRLSQNIFVAIPREGTVQTPHRLVPIPITSSSSATDRAMVVDVATGSMVLLDDLRDPKKTSLIGVNHNIYEKLPRVVARPRVITAVAKINSSGATEGAWLFDSVTGNIVFLENLQKLAQLEIKTVEERAR